MRNAHFSLLQLLRRFLRRILYSLLLYPCSLRYNFSIYVLSPRYTSFNIIEFLITQLLPTNTFFKDNGIFNRSVYDASASDKTVFHNCARIIFLQAADRLPLNIRLEAL